MDPYYEQWTKKGTNRRESFMGSIYDSHLSKNNTNLMPKPLLDYRGPGFLQNPGPGQGNVWKNNDDLDPIISNYERIYPWRPSFTRSKPGEWILYNTPKKITERLENVKIARYSQNQGPNSFNPELIDGHRNPNPVPPDPASPNALDWLYCFEGGTGSVLDTPSNWSIMGYVLVEEQGGGDYNVYIVFRGSRSGRANRELPRTGAFRKGNPDWVTDMDFKTKISDSVINTKGEGARGFQTSMKTMLRTIFTCLDDINARKGRPPEKIYVTGHSLGGALAVNFASAIRCSNQDSLSNHIFGRAMPLLPTWPWHEMKLVTFGAPIVGDEEFAIAVNVGVPTIKRCLLEGDPVAYTHDILVAALTKSDSRIPLPNPKNIWLGVHVGTKIGLLIDKSLLDYEKKWPTPPTHLHETFHIRRGLIAYFQNLNPAPSLSDIPAIDPKDQESPWQTFALFTELTQRLTDILGNQNIEPVFEDYRANLAPFIDILSVAILESLPLGSTFRNTLDNISNACRNNPGNPLDANTLLQLWTDQGWIKNINEDLHSFIGLCLYMIAASEDKNTFIALARTSNYGNHVFH